MPIYPKPEYPVVQKQPGAGIVLRNFTFKDYMQVTAFTFFSAVIGYCYGLFPFEIFVQQK
jgi:hypothetical protein